VLVLVEPKIPVRKMNIAGEVSQVRNIFSKEKQGSDDY